MQNNNVGKPPASPSWIFLRDNRSTSMPMIQRHHRGSSYSQQGRGEGRLKSWAQSILSGVGVTPSPEKKPSILGALSERRRMVSSDRRFKVPPHGNLSFSTFNKVEKSPPQDSLPANVRVGIVLVHLKEQLPKYCQLLQEPTFANSQEACQVLAQAIARSLPSAPANGGSPKTGSGSSPHSQSSPKSTPSPSRSPLRSLFSRGGDDSSPPGTHHRSLLMDSALALEREWERYTMPLQLLAASEALYANLHHAHHHDTGYLQSQLEGLYRWLLDDLTLVKETLCDSVIGTTPATPNDHRLLFLQETAQKIAPILLVLASLAKQRCRLIQYQSTLWETGGRKQYALMAEAMDNMGKNWSNEWSLLKIDNSVVSGLVESLSNELAIWKHLLETASYMEKCRFTESILSMRKTKVRLDPSSKLKIDQWFWKTLKQMIASSYLYFDRVKTFAKPLYGFQNAAFVDTDNTNKARMGGCPHALEDKVLDFLHKQQKSGTADVAVTIVHDAVQTSNLHMERGFTLLESISSVTEEEEESKFTEVETTRLHWPAAYMRTTKYHGEAQVGVGLLGGKRRTTSRRNSGDPNSSSFSEHYKRWGSKDASSPTKASDDPTHEATIQRSTLEYPPDHGSVSWPHTEWESVVGLITGSGDLPSTARLVSNRETSTVTEEHGFFAFLGQSTSASNLQKSKEIQMECVVRRANNGRSAFWLAELSEFSWLVVMTKTEEESRWHRRRGSRFDDVEEFVQLLVSNLRVENCFQTLPTEDLQNFASENDLLQGIQSVNDWNEKSAEDFLRSVKYAFGLSSTKPKGDQAYQNRRFRIGNISPSLSILPMNQPPPKPQLPIDASAMAFFLGSDLMTGLAE